MEAGRAAGRACAGGRRPGDRHRAGRHRAARRGGLGAHRRASAVARHRGGGVGRDLRARPGPRRRRRDRPSRATAQGRRWSAAAREDRRVGGPALRCGGRDAQEGGAARPALPPADRGDPLRLARHAPQARPAASRTRAAAPTGRRLIPDRRGTPDPRLRHTGRHRPRRPRSRDQAGPGRGRTRTLHRHGRARAARQPGRVRRGGRATQ